MADSSIPASKLTAKARYERRVPDRQQFLDRARQCSELTFPTLIPPAGRNSTTKYYTPWQGIGARGVNNLASKLLLSLLPPNAPFFRMSVDDITKDKLAGDPKFKSKVDQGLSKYERVVQSDIEQTGLRSPMFLTFKYLIVGGNALVTLPADGGMRTFPLDRYIVCRDPMGTVLEAITMETVDRETLDEDVQQLIAEDTPGMNGLTSDPKDHADVEIYTRYFRKGKNWKSYQEIEGKLIPGSEGSWPIDNPPFIALRWVTVEGEDYGRSYVEEYLGDLVALEGLSKAVVEAAAISAKVVFLVRPNGVTKAKSITEAESGDAVTGTKDDVHALQVEKHADLRVAHEAIKTITDRLAYAFLMNSAVQRNGERVTAEEIRYMAGELEDALGGVYSILAQEFQLPLVNRIINRLTKAKKLPTLPKGVAKPVIITGLEALGRGHDLNKLMQFGQMIQQMGPAGAAFVNWSEFLARAANSMSIDPEGLIKTPEDIQAEQAQAAQVQQGQQMSDIIGKAAPAAIKAMSDQVTAAGQSQQGAAPVAQ